MNDIFNNILLLSDSYKVSHYRQYPPGTQKVYSYFEARGGYAQEVMFYGLQYFLKRYLRGNVITEEKIQYAKEIFNPHFFGDSTLFNEKGWRNLLKKYGGTLPVRIKAVPEGVSVPVGNALMVIENTDLEFYWLTNYLETLLVETWYGCTVGTLSREIKKVINGYLEETGDSSGLPFKLHDFGFRGVSSPESAAIGGSAHLVNFLGTDTVLSLILAKEFYGAKTIAGHSIPAAEHSTITAWGQDNEVQACRNMLIQFPTGYVAVVSDSYDIYHTCKQIWGKELKQMVLDRNGVLVVRPDSGEPTLAIPKLLEILGDAFGYVINDRNYKVLNPNVRMIWGDGINFQSITAILEEMKQKGWSADNIAFGMGGALLQRLDRDTHMFAFKCCYAHINGKEVDVSKNPVDTPWKKSKKGKLTLAKVRTEEGEQYATIRESELNRLYVIKEVLVPVFENGKILKEYTFEEVRENARL